MTIRLLFVTLLAILFHTNLAADNPTPSAYYEKPSAIVLQDDNFDATVSSGIWLVMISHPYSSLYQQIASTWSKLAAKVNSANDDIKVASVDCQNNAEMTCKTYGFSLPTLKLIRDGQMMTYVGPLTLETIDQFAEQDIQDVVETIGRSISQVKILTNSNFNESVATGTWFVRFSAPWSGHCKHIGPTWERLAQDMQSIPDVSIALVDCTVHHDVCTSQAIWGYPTLKIFKDGVAAEPYSGQRTLGELRDYAMGFATTNAMDSVHVKCAVMIWLVCASLSVAYVCAGLSVIYVCAFLWIYG
eukprot:TRINITY_DN4891_c0_g1::TRINITY_DN4891_c0_g1_i1::g.906::m.906 TRINITY_DN4891_c0_g1::TRINITY_DN4891_c0_g1_i1::g.906  ORF type:complete len:301 (+),score=39.03,sp/Q8NBS9/TXND5_HUMAN/36.49/2e-36,sp/Q8NBS9/TXND5_HUMAN/30.66/3e-33,sp/Q8NBS9/TXND5_HUMAN/39.45/5e-19,Thioredoxin/PF00085.15/9.4e-10,Thioredoxin/PF00085.15/1.3e-23,Thioredoxin_8/PF13905.1/16,Thioredoxin_8/PF13905.1/0.085 TRINITY_DN4891_c0_g1_i1:84-986(+)